MTNTLIIYYPIISVCAGLSPSIKTKVRPSLLSDYRAEFSANKIDINLIMGDHLTKIYLSLARYFACLSTCIVLCKIPLFLGHDPYNMEKVLNQKDVIKQLYILSIIFIICKFILYLRGKLK